MFYKYKHSPTQNTYTFTWRLEASQTSSTSRMEYRVQEGPYMMPGPCRQWTAVPRQLKQESFSGHEWWSSQSHKTGKEKLRILATMTKRKHLHYYVVFLVVLSLPGTLYVPSDLWTNNIQSVTEHYKMHHIKVTQHWAGEMAQWLRALPALLKVLSSIPSNHMVTHNHL